MNLAAVLLAGMVSGDMPPPEAPGIEVPLQCDARACIMPRQLGRELLEAHNFHVERIRELERRLAVLAEAKGCGKVEVVPKPVPNFKKDRDV